ncbi:universal stress protein [Janthinobacterium sp. 17J80-10]|uniref:universal stress protein n=1 Tax=Janthinobacterium sp. 17J80-10 TaxID=2497863 RepID=UPI00100550B3|nr:universal stress protein [Janthinobacterium sp. 17J80-10]QAU35600.1 universal stress protein [Janthinobacterium sp. 17J80-10]
MSKILIPIDDSPSALRALAYLVQKIQTGRETAELHLINVQYPVHGGVSAFVNAAQIRQLHQEDGAKALASASKTLDDAGIPYMPHVFVGDPAEVVARFANEQGIDEIVMGARGQNQLSTLLLGSVSLKILNLARAPVLLVK